MVAMECIVAEVTMEVPVCLKDSLGVPSVVGVLVQAELRPFVVGAKLRLF